MMLDDHGGYDSRGRAIVRSLKIHTMGTQSRPRLGEPTRYFACDLLMPLPTRALPHPTLLCLELHNRTEAPPSSIVSAVVLLIAVVTLTIVLLMSIFFRCLPWWYHSWIQFSFTVSFFTHWVQSGLPMDWGAPTWSWVTYQGPRTRKKLTSATPAAFNC